MRAIRVLKQLMQNLENSQLHSTEKRDQFADVISLNNIPPTDSLGLSSRIINVLKSDLLVLCRIQKQLELGEVNPFQVQLNANDQDSSNNQIAPVSQQDNDLIEKINEWYNENNKIKISSIIELIKMCVRKVEKGEDIEIQKLVNAYDPEYGLLFCHLFCLAIEQVLNFTKLIQIEEIIAKCLNRMIDGINFQNMQYLETIISDNLKKLEQVMLITNQYLPEQHSIVVIFEKYNNLLQKLSVQNSIFYSNNQVIPNFNDLQGIIIKIQDYLYNPSPIKSNQDQQFIVAQILEETLGIFNGAFQRFQNIQLDHKSRHILYDRIEKIIVTCQMSPQYIQYQQHKDQTNSVTPKYSLHYNLNESSFYSQNSKTMSSMSYLKKRTSTIQQDYKILLNTLKRIGEYLISKNDNVIVLKDNNNQINYICKHNQNDFSNPLEKLINSQNNYIQNSETELSDQKQNGKNYSQIYKQIVLNSKYFNHIMKNKQIYEQQLQNIIYKRNQYEKEGAQILLGLKSALIIEINDQNLEQILLDNNSSLVITITDKLSGEQICETSLKSNINSIQLELPFSILPCNLQILEKQHKNSQDQKNNSIDSNLQENTEQLIQNESQSYLLFEKDICLTQFINTYLRLKNESYKNSTQINLKEFIDSSLDLDRSQSPQLSSIDISYSPEMEINQAPVFPVFQNALQSYSLSPSRSKRVSQDTIYKGSLKSIEEENYSSISANNIDMLKDKKRLKGEKKQSQQEPSSIRYPLNQDFIKDSEKSKHPPQNMCKSKEEQFTKFRFFIETKQIQAKENNFKNKNILLNKELPVNQSLEIDEVNLFKDKNIQNKNIEKQSQRQNNQKKKNFNLPDSDYQDLSKQTNFNDSYLNNSMQKTRSQFGSQDSLNDRQEEKAQKDLNPKTKQLKQINFIKPSQNNVNNHVIPQQINQKLKNKQNIEKNQQNKLQKINQLSPLSNTQKLNLTNKSNQSSIDNSMISFPNSKRNSQLQKHDFFQNSSINTSVVSIQYSQNDSLQPYQQHLQIGKSKILEKQSSNSRIKSNYYYSLEQSKENITIFQQKNYNLIHNNTKIHKTSVLKNINQKDNMLQVIQNKDKRSKSVQPHQISNLNKLDNLANSVNQVSQNTNQNQFKMRNQKLKLEDENNLDFDVNTQIKSFYGVLHELKTTKINIDM
ncbi:hypothetical protein TTHERM_00313590 (macronuclear) [Tetrahymena thermophila SB210]|uniref:Uncharacterized protein n=1 Tax=Tetrahymena thermophila (strain SB210) TaxID=312017 RepID=Q22KC2_TETTS|nr:hypothetical protein TTHERM_00313590 [Tetrahymena thermophila SB210]EAR85877.1 hypothetical protein TTHERM_00313590 [Tetrahymena thermophila SB210]|eukprot:XP_001033540.1 hypothetical protein TTHERM_00313590 [Tetrahymena thermophila SB210]